MNVGSLGGVPVYDITVNLMKDRYPNGSTEVLKSILLLKATVMLKLVRTKFRCKGGCYINSSPMFRMSYRHSWVGDSLKNPKSICSFYDR